MRTNLILVLLAMAVLIAHALTQENALPLEVDFTDPGILHLNLCRSVFNKVTLGYTFENVIFGRKCSGRCLIGELINR